MKYFDEAHDSDTFLEIGRWLEAVVTEAEPRLHAIAEDQASIAREPGKWSGKETLGHLIDSAANNHQRIVRAQSESLVQLPGYEQDEWVSHQYYRERPWSDLVDFWCSYNRHLAHVLGRIPESRRNVPCEIGGSDAVTLSYIALDYIGHVEHHLKQIPDILL
jgi:hypothetical protein